MAYITENSNTLTANISSAFNVVGNFFTNFMLDLYNSNPRRGMIEELQAMNDATLRAKHGIKRSEIVSYVFHDKLML